MEIQISDKIRDLRKARDMMQEQLAEALGVSTAAVSKWERGAAVPELGYILEMADLFGVSVDALVGYRVRSGGAEDLEKRIHTLQREKRYSEATAEAEKALVRYPNHFRLVYRCGEVYQLMGLETGDSRALERAAELLDHAVALLPQNTDPEICEATIRAEIALCLTALGKRDQGIELLKRYNQGGCHNSTIGMQYAISDTHKPEEAAPYLMKAYADCFQKTIQTMMGYANYYAKMKNRQALLDTELWAIRYLESMKERADAVTYVDKMRSVLYADCANQAHLLGREEEAEAWLRRAAEIAKAFDAAPVYDAREMKFCIGEVADARAYDDLGQTAVSAIETQTVQGEWDEDIRALWEQIKAGER